MSANPSTTTEEARSNQTPPALRNWAREECEGVDDISRFSEDCETTGRGWAIKAERVRLGQLPDGFKPGNVSALINGSGVYVQVRED